MATYSEITDPEIDQDSPVTAILMEKYRDNLTAVIEGDTSSPGIRGLAAAPNSKMPVLTVSAADTYDITESNDLTVGTLVDNAGSFVVAYTIDIVAVTGTVRFKISQVTTTGAEARVLKNGSVVSTYSTSGSATHSADISVVPTDQIIWQHRQTSGGQSNVSNPVQTATDGHTRRGLLIAYSDL